MATHKGFSLVLPCLDEHESIAMLISRIDGIRKESKIPLAGIIIVDDSENDLTAHAVAKLKIPVPIRLIHRGAPKGLSSAIFEGAAAGCADFVIVMDADGQHRPEDILGIWNALQAGNGIAIGSRHAKGGTVSSEWGLHRKIISSGAALLANGLANGRTQDPLSGFFGFSKNKVKLERMKPFGYKFLLELLVRNPKAKVKDVPILFLERKAGKTKLGLRQMEEYLIEVARLHAVKFLKRY